MRACKLTFISVAFMLVGAGWISASPEDSKPPTDLGGNREQTGGRELHVVGIYEGFTKSNGKIHGGKALVNVNRPGKHVTLVLVSYEPVTWEITVNDATSLEKVILGGSHLAAVKGITEKVEIVEAFRGSKKPALSIFDYDANSPRFHALVVAIDAMTGQKISSFSGKYRADPGQPIVVASIQADPRLSADFPRPVAAEPLPKMTFPAHSFVPGKRRFDVSKSYGEFTLTGPNKNTLKSLPRGVERIAYDQTAKKYYGISNHGIAVVDMEKRTATNIAMGLEVPKMNWPADITFDTRRERLLVTTSTNGYLFAYYPKTQKWEVIVDNLDAPALTYHPKDDALYGLKGDGSGELFRLNEKGKKIKTVKLDGQFLPAMLRLGPGVTGAQLIPADDKLILMLAPVGLIPSGGAEPKWSFIYLVDQKTGKAQLTWKAK